MKKLFGIALKAAVSVALLYVAIAQVDFAVVSDRLSQVSAGWLIASFAVAHRISRRSSSPCAGR